MTVRGSPLLLPPPPPLERRSLLSREHPSLMISPHCALSLAPTVPAFGFAYTVNPITFKRFVPGASTPPTYGAGAGAPTALYVVSPPFLPSGLQINESSGVIYGNALRALRLHVRGRAAVQGACLPL